ncbi:MAG TPA: metallophosphoesterase [Deltaproteobacteria bacterium]|nr:metallophosphoesterase [Deltaproteobacteria bacterium]HPR56348.1 metallophosphoesterase [Deltaproteobacteria bacterium]HXK46058.1 metallophosphoesterase [Deltaproteobacteria bacterium]
MRIIYLTDIHGDFERVKNLLSETVAHLYIIGGDLIDIPFYNMETSIRYYELQSYFHGLRMKMGEEDSILEDFVDQLLESPDITEEIQDKGTRYQQYTIRARRVMQQKYKLLKNIVSMKKKSRVLCLPGNYDMDLKYTSLHDNDLHMHWYKIDDLRICGYGGAEVWTPGIPERYIVRYQAGMSTYGKKNGKRNEMYPFLRVVKPNIIVAHQPAYGIHDNTSAGGAFGSPVLRTYCDNNPVMLCLTGHAHDSWGVRLHEGTLYLNPSNFGQVTGPTGEVTEGGFFFQIETDNLTAKSVILKKYYDGLVFDVADYYPGSGKWSEEIIDRDRYNALKNRQNYDMKVVKYSHIPEIQLFKEIKQFFRMYQTPETEERVDKLEEVVDLIEDKLKGDIAMDVMGSVNMGTSHAGSDIDLVLYLRCGPECIGEPGECDISRQTQSMIRDLLGSEFEPHFMDCLDLNQVEKSILEKNFECEQLQRFVAYRSICRPINYRVIAPIEDLLNADMIFRKEVEGSTQSYIQIFANTSEHVRSLKKYESRLNELGIRVPESVKRTIKQYLRED